MRVGWASLLLLLTLPTFPRVEALTIVSLAIAAPLANDSARCASAWARFSLASSAVAAVTGASWWPPHLALALEHVPAPDSAVAVDGWLRAAAFAGVGAAAPRCALATGAPCAIVRAGLVSLGSAAARALAHVALAGPLALIATDARTVDDMAAGAGAAARAPVFRLGASADDVGGAAWDAVLSRGWQVVVLVYAAYDADSAGAANALLARAGGVLSGAAHDAAAADSPRVTRAWPLFAAGDVPRVVGELRGAEPHVVILFAPAPDAAIFLREAQAAHLWGKAWTWVGDAWVSDLASGSANLQGAAAPLLGGAIGVSSPTPFSPLALGLARTTTASAGNATRATLGAVLARAGGSFVTAGGASAPFEAPLLDATSCAPAFTEPMLSSGLPLDAAGAAVFDAVYLLAAAAAACAPTALSPPTAACVAGALAGASPPHASPLTGRAATFSPSGDELEAPLSLVNARIDGSLAVVGAWTRGGGWGVLAPIQWGGGGVLTPSDRVAVYDETYATAFLIVLLGIVASLLAAAVVHRAGFAETLPESLLTVVVGLLIGACVRAAATPEVRDAAAFSNEIFLLALLPIIIAESGYSIDKRVFFSQLWSITTFAVVGTVVSALVIGGVVYAAGQGGAVLTLSFEEAMAFASLLSATDPVATLAVFGSLRVDPVLNALVYGESVVNDAVGIVLFRVWASFITEDVTRAALGIAVARFLSMLLVSIALGFFVGFACTAVFRVVFADTIRAAIENGGARGAPPSSDPTPRRRGRGRGVLLTILKGAARVIRVGGAPVYAQLESSSYEGVGETMLVLVFLYASFALTEALAFSGIVAALFCGIALSQYTRRIMSHAGKRMATAVLRLLASLADTVVFLQIGMTVSLAVSVRWSNVGLFFVSLAGCLLGRALNIAPLSFLLNCFRKQPIAGNMQAQMWWAGLRGAIAFSSATAFPSQHRAELLNVTAWICLATIFAMGPTTPAVLRLLKIPYNCADEAPNDASGGGGGGGGGAAYDGAPHAPRHRA